MGVLTVKYNELSAEEFIGLWEMVWGQAPSLEQTRLAMEHTLFRVSVFESRTLSSAPDTRETASGVC